ncbi:unnamed protein product [Timema podura]|uniref:Uncharacterized protein n=1 Tax=Timema podura TaxID=61482 RepID=A0ABN7NMF4_TIMPD|nr:unnamed protein product [Timema podura]
MDKPHGFIIVRSTDIAIIQLVENIIDKIKNGRVTTIFELQPSPGPQSEIDVPTKSEGFFNEEVDDYQQPQCVLGSVTPPIKDELPYMTHFSGQTDYKASLAVDWTAVDGEIGKHQENSSNEEGCSKWAVSVIKCAKYVGTKPKCKEGCTKNDKVGAKCIQHGDTKYRKTFDEEGSSKWATRASKSMTHGGTQTKNTCKEEGCTKWPKRGGDVNVLNMEERSENVKKTRVQSILSLVVNVLNMEEPSQFVKKKAAQRFLRWEIIFRIFSGSGSADQSFSPLCDS